MPLLIVGTLDTKGEEIALVRDLVTAAGVEALVVDVGVMDGESGVTADITAAEVAEAGGADLAALRGGGDRGAALQAMSEGASAITERLHAEGRLDGLLGLGGSGGSSIVAAAAAVLPVGVPKLLVSTMVSGDVSPYVGESDMTLMYSVVDIAGVNVISRQVLRNAAAAAAGMARAYAAGRAEAEPVSDRPLVAASMFGVTTPAVERAKDELETLGYDVVVFHATGAGGRSMEALIRSGWFAGVLDLTTTEIADEVVGGVLSAGPTRLTGAAATGTPQVVSLGAIDMVNFGPRATVPAAFEDRTLLVHNATVTLMRTTPEEATTIGRTIGERVASATGPTVVLVPAGGFSAVDVPGGPFADPDADDAAVAALQGALSGSGIEVVVRDEDVNDPAFATDAARRLHDLITNRNDPNGDPS